ncbi:MAG: hypothetical protein ACE5JG_09810, partial [Planctomycetota bacterium]
LLLALSAYSVAASDEIAVIEGPLLGGARPRGVLRNLGMSRLPLERLADQVAASLDKRGGRRVTGRGRRSIGPFPAVRLGLGVEEGGGRGRGRMTLVRLGLKVFSLELSAPTSNFPSGAYEQIEASLEVRWTRRTTPTGLALELPPGWTVEEKGARRLVVAGPVVGAGRPMVVVERPEPGAKPAPETGSLGPVLRFLRRRLKTRRVERCREGATLVRVAFRTEGWAGGVIIPAEVYDDHWPVAAAILERMAPVPVGPG